MTFRSVLAGLDWSYLSRLLLSAVPALLCIMIHEICHGAAAYALGDRTAATQGRLSLNPLRHIDWFGLLMLMIFHFGWAKPVSVDMRNFKNPKRDMAVTALAGPLSNFVLAVLALFLFGLGYRALADSKAGNLLLSLLNGVAYLSIALGLFNLIPIPPLDGSKVLFAFLPDKAYVRLMVLERYGMILLIVLVVLMNRVFAVSPVAAASEAVYDAFFRIAVFADSLIK
ncbi:MAG: site-2 protease family protein [Oscillospiraceae bacterium]|nr:site-2 protease family protein [Oscillospiraceae bacterium]